MSNWEKNVRKVVPYVPGEQPHEADMIKLNTNENPYPPSPKAAEAIRRVAEEDTLSVSIRIRPRQNWCRRLRMSTT